MKVISASIFLLVFAVYAFMTAPAITPFRDTGEVVTAVSTLGIAHSPGYPLYVLAGKAFSSLAPWGNPGYKLNLFSSLCGAVCVMLVFMAVSGLCGVLSGLLSGIFLAVAPAFVCQSIIAEVYVLNALIGVSILLTLIWISKAAGYGSKSRYFYLAMFFMGIGLGNHHTLVLLFPVFIFTFIAIKFDSDNAIVNVHRIIGVAVVFLIGFSVYMYIYLRGHYSPAYFWGSPDTVKGLFKIISRSDYGSMALSTRYSKAGFTAGFLLFLKLLYGQFNIVVLLTGLCGFLLLGNKSHRNAVLFAATGFFLTGPFFAAIARMNDTPFTRAILEPAVALPAVFYSLLVGFGFYWLKSKARVLRFFIAALLVISIMPGLKRLGGISQRNNLLARDYHRNILRNLPCGSVLLTISDTATFSLFYAKEVFGLRRDVKVLVDANLPWRWGHYRKLYPELFAEGQGSGGRQLVEYQSGRFNIYTEGMHAGLIDQLCPSGCVTKAFWPKRPGGRRCHIFLKNGEILWDFLNKRIFDRGLGSSDYYNREILKNISGAAYNTGVLIGAYSKSDAERMYKKSLLWDGNNAAARESIFGR